MRLLRSARLRATPAGAPGARVWRVVSAACVAVLAASLAGGCGGIIAPDLFVVYRSGSTPAARLTLLVNEEGVVHCNGVHARHRLSDPQLIQARTIQERLHDYAARHESLPPRPGSVLSYRVRDQDGEVSFADNSSHQPRVLRELALFVLRAAGEVCGLSQGRA